MPLRLDHITVNHEDEATTLMLHHLHIAALLFEGTHDDHGAKAKELILARAPIEQPAMNAFVDALIEAYESME
jgi:hypothetical protein